MINYNPLLCKDAYKACHPDQYDPEMTKLVAYYTPRVSRLPDVNKVTVFGIQAFIKEYLIEAMNEYFFKQDADFVINQYLVTMNAIMNDDGIGYDRLLALHKLGYLPLEIHALPEGVRSNIGVPQICITNTHPDFVWVVNVFESMMSCTIWHTQLSAEVGFRYKSIANKFAALTCDDNIQPECLAGDFSMRGQESIESATKSSAAFLLSFYNTATVPASLWLEKYYNCDIKTEIVGVGALSTEHSTMCSRRAIDGDEITFIRKLLTEIYPDKGFSIVADSIDYWNLVDNILPELKDEIMNHKGYLGIRGDSGNPVDIVIDTVKHLAESFGYITNVKGYKMLPPQLKVIYGDSITPQRLEEIYKRAADEGFAASNFMLASGSFSMQCLETFNEDGTVSYSPYTRDTFGVAIKTTYGEIHGKGIEIFKDPITDTDSFKKSPKGCIRVYKTDTGYEYEDQLPWRDACIGNALDVVFRDGKMVKETSLREIRENLSKERS